ncbi:MAG: heme exporter protein CcmD [Saccharospirillaceae bacterium]|jgi:heme exporter protein D|nr:heme exporter CcmD [Thalassolituus sp. HI0120]MCH2040349.1 heme exporter protein CcmD [Saccharospirillaceae bacterium]
MQFDSIAEFIAMGGHGFYVWLAYGLTAAIILFNVMAPVIARRKLIKEQSQRLRRERGRSAKKSQVESNDAPSA